MVISVCSITLFILSRLFFFTFLSYMLTSFSRSCPSFFLSFFLPSFFHIITPVFYYFLFIHHSLVLFFSLACLHCLHLSLTPPFSFSVILYPFHSFVFFSLLSFFHFCSSFLYHFFTFFSSHSLLFIIPIFQSLLFSLAFCLR